MAHTEGYYRCVKEKMRRRAKYFGKCEVCGRFVSPTNCVRREAIVLDRSVSIDPPEPEDDRFYCPSCIEDSED